jgi:hypothetical protein
MPGASGKQSEKGFEKDKVTMRKKIRGPSRGRTQHRKISVLSCPLFVVGDWQHVFEVS